MSEMIYNKTSHLKKEITEALKTVPNQEYPLVYFYKEDGMESRKVKITLEIIETDYIRDKFGRKWVRSDDSE